MLKCLYWNVSKKNKSADNYAFIRCVVEQMISEWGLDIVFLADFHVNLLTKNWTWKPASATHEYFSVTEKKKRNKRIITLFRKGFDLKRAYPTVLNDYSDILSLKVRNEIINLISVHIKSLANTNDEGQLILFKNDLDSINSLLQIKPKAIIFGDFNNHPWNQSLLIHPQYFNATPDRFQALNTKRNYLGEEYPFLYNPTWSLMGDFLAGTGKLRPPASHYYDDEAKAKELHSHYYWEMFEQLLMTPNVIELFDFTQFELVTRCRNHVFWDKTTGMIDSTLYSDHLPLKFGINL